MKTRPGETLIDCLDSIEDTKGNNGDRGNAEYILIALAHISHISLIMPISFRPTFGYKPENHLAFFGLTKSELM